MTPEFIERVKRDYEQEINKPDWASYLAGYWAATKRFGGKRVDRRETRSKLGYSRVGRWGRL